MHGYTHRHMHVSHTTPGGTAASRLHVRSKDSSAPSPRHHPSGNASGRLCSKARGSGYVRLFRERFRRVRLVSSPNVTGRCVMRFECKRRPCSASRHPSSVPYGCVRSGKVHMQAMQAGRQAGRQADRQTDRQTGRQAGRQAGSSRVCESVQAALHAASRIVTVGAGHRQEDATARCGRAPAT